MRKLLILTLLFMFIGVIFLPAQVVRENTRFLERQLQKLNVNYLEPFVQKTDDEVNVFFYFVPEKWKGEMTYKDIARIESVITISMAALISQTTGNFERVHFGVENKTISYCEAKDVEKVWRNYKSGNYATDAEFLRAIVNIWKKGRKE